MIYVSFDVLFVLASMTVKGAGTITACQTGYCPFQATEMFKDCCFGGNPYITNI